jgi:hypothetical protein
MTLSTGCYKGTPPPEAEGETDGSGTSATGPGGGPGSDSDPTDTDGNTGDDPEDPEEPSQAPSSKARVKFKGAQRYGRDLADALSLDRAQLCQELAEYDCFDVHNIALGGVDPYDAAVFEPLQTFGVASPIAADRIALTACGERSEIDFAQPGTSVIFQNVAGGSADGDSLRSDARRLYLRILRREPEDTELDALAEFHGEIPDGPNHDQTWAHMSCFAVATSLESLFY